MSVRSSEWLANDWAARRGMDDLALDTARLDRIVEDAVSRVERSATSMMEKVGKVLETQSWTRGQRPLSRDSAAAALGSANREDELLRRVQRAQSVARSKSPKPPSNIKVILYTTGQCVQMAWPEVEAHLKSNRMGKDENGNLIFYDHLPHAPS